MHRSREPAGDGTPYQVERAARSGRDHELDRLPRIVVLAVGRGWRKQTEAQYGQDGAAFEIRAHTHHSAAFLPRRGMTLLPKVSIPSIIGAKRVIMMSMPTSSYRHRRSASTCGLPTS